MRRLLISLLFVMCAPSVSAQTFLLGWEPNTDQISGYKVFDNGVEIGSTTDPQWSLTPVDFNVHRFTTKAFFFVTDPATGTLLETRVSDFSNPSYVQRCAPTQIVARFFGGMNQTTAPKVAQVCYDALNFSWAAGGPFPELTETFGANFDIPLIVDSAGTAVFSLTCDDGCRLFVDGELLIEQWFDQPATTYTATKTLTAGPHQAVIPWYENGGDAVIQFGVSFTPAPPPPPPPPPPPGDTIPPMTGITAARQNQTHWIITAVATDNVGVVRIDIRGNGVVWKTCTVANGQLIFSNQQWSCRLNTTRLVRGSNTITSEARDAVGLRGVATIQVVR